MMKNKNIYILISFGCVLLLFVFLLLMFCNKKVICTNSSDQSSNGYVLKTKYVIKANFNKVNTITITENIVSKDKNVLDKFEKQLNDNYSYNKKTYGGYSYKVTNGDGKVTSNVTINYKKFDMKKFIDDNEAMKKFTKNNKLTLSGAKKMYESTGAVCK